MTQLTLPISTYHVMTDFGPRIGVGNGGDFTTTPDDCADQVANLEGNPWRAFRIDLCADTNNLVHCEDVTAEISVILARCANRGAGE
jgi:hypothetical protein